MHLEASDMLLWTEGPDHRQLCCHVPTLARLGTTTRKRPWPCGKELLQRGYYAPYDPTTDLGWAHDVDDLLAMLPGDPFGSTRGDEEDALANGQCPQHRTESHPLVAGTSIGTYADLEDLIADKQE